MLSRGAACTFAVALACEAKPLVHYYQLKKDEKSTVFPVYRHAEIPLQLIVTGVGKIAMAAGVGYLQQYLGLTKNSIYLNVGIAGGAYFSPGELVIAHKIIDAATQKALYPNISLLNEARFDEVISFDQPQNHYPEKGLVDMEAAAFFQAASFFAYQDGIQCIKIISDTCLEEMQGLTAAKISALVAEQVPMVDAIRQQVLVATATDAVTAVVVDPFTQRWHFSVYQSNQLKLILQRWQLLLPNTDPISQCQRLTSAKQVLQGLTDHLENLSYRW